MKRKTEPEVHVGILLAEHISFWLEGGYRSDGGETIPPGEARAILRDGSMEILSGEQCFFRGQELLLHPVDPDEGRFGLKEVRIGIGFHWEQKEDQLFGGKLHLQLTEQGIRAVNRVPVEDYLVSVISSEMSGMSSLSLLRAHAVISRSWLLAQMEKRSRLESAGTDYKQVHEDEGEYIRWYDREDHQDFHVCADDHCQRYQGLTRATRPEVRQAVKDTRGEVLVYGGEICDARFSKCCGGVTEKFEYCWEAVEHPYLQRVEDSDRQIIADLKVEENASDFIGSRPDAYCNTTDDELLAQVLNDYDRDAGDFYRWKVTYSREELSALIRKKSGMDFGEIAALEPVERGESGRLVRLRIVGSEKRIIVGKELEIRRWLSPTHLRSSAFVVEKRGMIGALPELFILHGAGWGHGVGLCQIGAAVMASRGHAYHEILSHYFRNASIEKEYE